MTPFEAFEMLDFRVGRVRRVEANTTARKPAFKLWIDFGPLGVKSSSAQLTSLYTVESLMNRLIIAAVNIGERKIAGFTSEVLVLGVPDVEGNVVLLEPERDVPLGGRIY